MKKNIVNKLLEVADTLPIIYEWKMVPEVFTGEELNTTPLADKVKFKPDQEYTYPMPAMVAVDHRQQLKDAFKHSGIDGVQNYFNQTMDKAVTIYGNNYSMHSGGSQ